MPARIPTPPPEVIVSILPFNRNNREPNNTQTPPRRFRFRRDDESGLTTLEWLLIVAAVAGLAALAVVLVTRVVGDTAEQISGNNARLTAARVAADDITTRARAKSVTGSAEATAANTEFKSDCNQLRIIYSDIDGLQAIWSNDIETGPAASPPTLPAVGDVSQAQWTTGNHGCYITAAG